MKGIAIRWTFPNCERMKEWIDTGAYVAHLFFVEDKPMDYSLMLEINPKENL